MTAMLESLPNPQAASKWCVRRRAAGQRIGYVPTMGALHRGHLALLQRAARENDVACASIFVNPLQFNRREDLDNYPRDRQRDTALLAQVGCRMVYTGTLAQFFPELGVADNPSGDPSGDPSSHETAALMQRLPAVDAGPAARGLEGAFRPGHLPGVAQIVARLFHTVGPCRAYFGEKDFQQTLVVAALAKGFAGLEVVACPTVRAPSGVALSSRNQHLSAAELTRAAALYATLQAAQSAWRQGLREAAALEAVMRKHLAEHGGQHGTKPAIALEYAAVRDPLNWSENTPPGALKQARALLAAHLGEVRLIDNMAL